MQSYLDRKPSSSAPAAPAAEVQRKSSLRGMSFDAQEAALAPVQLKEGDADPTTAGAIAQSGVKGSGGRLPHLDKVQAAFGRHDVSGVSAHVGGSARQATDALGASAYATGNDVAFGGAPDLHTTAHEAAHVVQQRAGVQLYGGVGKAGDAYEKQADAVADRVVAGQSAEGLLDGMAGPAKAGAASAGKGGPVQMYSRVPVAKQAPDNWQAGEDLRVADDGKLAVPEANSHRMFATPGVIAKAARVMQDQGSRYTLAAGGQTIQGDVPNQRGHKTTLVEVVPTNLLEGTSGDDMTTTEACSTHGQEVMGAGITQGAHPLSKGLAAVIGGEGHEEERRWDRINGGDNDLVASLRDEMTGRRPTHERDDKKKSEKAYEKLSDRRRKSRAKRLGINQYAQPQVGEGIATYNAVSKLKNGFPMHFAAVIARSGGDYVTFENFAKNKPSENPEEEVKNPRAEGDTAEASKAWYFKMYGPPKKGDDQSFFGQHVKDGEQGGKRGTMVLRHRKKEGFANDAIVEGERCRNRWMRYAGSRMDRDRTPRFKQAYDAFDRCLTAVKHDGRAAWLRDETLPEARFEELTALTNACAQTQIGSYLLEHGMEGAPSVESEVEAQQHAPQVDDAPNQDPHHDDEQRHEHDN